MNASARTFAPVLLATITASALVAARSANPPLSPMASTRPLDAFEDASRALPATGISYVRGREIRVIQPDGAGDRLLWAQPSMLPRSQFVFPIRDLAWRPDGGELAFASDHEQAYSWFQHDIYAVSADGRVLRRLTNPPAKDDMGRLPTGAVKVTLYNKRFDPGPYVVYATGASRPQTVLLAAGSAEIVTFTQVADLGEVVQPVVAIFGGQRYFGAMAPNVQPGRTVDVGNLEISSSSGVNDFGARAPAWRSDGGNVAFVLNPTCTVRDVPANPGVGPTLHALLDAKVYENFCVMARGPSPATADRLLLARGSDANTYVYLATEGSNTLGQPIAAFNDYNYISDLEWLPDASGFIMSRRDSLMDDDVNLYEYDFASRRLRKLTDLHSSDQHLGRFSISPDGRQIAYEWTAVSMFLQDRPGDIYVVNRDGTNPRLLVKDGLFPAWSPVRR